MVGKKRFVLAAVMLALVLVLALVGCMERQAPEDEVVMLGTTNFESVTLSGNTPKLTIGDAGAEDTSIVFDGNAQDFYVALDDSADDILIGLGSTVGTTPGLGIDENLAVATYGDLTMGGTTPVLTIGDAGAEDTAVVFDGNAQDFYMALYDTADDLILGLGSTVGTTGIVYLDENQDVGLGGASAGAKLDVTGNVLVDGAADEIQLTAQGYTTQTSSLMVLEQSDGTDVFTVSNAGNTAVAGTLGVTGVSSLDDVNQTINAYENIGGLPTLISATVAYTPASGTVATITDGEIWIIHSVFIQVTTNFDCTGDDCALTIGDGNDTDGFMAAADAALQTTFTEATGYAAGWYGLENGSNGDYTVDEGIFVYAPSGADETIDYAIAGTDPAAGECTVYILYTRVQ